jgi:hypothetical protein
LVADSQHATHIAPGYIRICHNPVLMPCRPHFRSKKVIQTQEIRVVAAGAQGVSPALFRQIMLWPLRQLVELIVLTLNQLVT